ncbi:MAG: leucyl aminopeptidase [Candidatus Obscuribacterales bacterium]|nr:leucyl aminopeptidase [Candidatus Obscuribacterales bacterium]
MKLDLESASLSRIKADLLVLGLFQDEDVRATIEKLDPDFPAQFLDHIAQMCQEELFKCKNKESISFFCSGQIGARKLVLVGLGKSCDYKIASVRKTVANLARMFGAKESCRHLILQLRMDGQSDMLRAAVEGWFLGSYNFLNYKKVAEDGFSPSLKTERLTFIDQKMGKEEFLRLCEEGRTIAESTNFARDLIAEPACVMTPSRLAEAAQSLVSASVECRVLEVEDVAAMGMGAYIGVAKGSHEPLKFISLKYAPANARKTITLIGKGITFDSGGLSLKTAVGMEKMKHDMSGAAAVLGAIRAVSELHAPIAVHVLIAACENMPGGGALRPGDVLTSMNGKTIEVNNTDAEGRLTLADALCYAGKEKTDAIIDIATLTGAVVSALGRAAAAIMGNDQILIEKMITAGEKSGEKYWQLPMFDEYKDSLKSDIADLKNAGSRGEAGTASAALFLKEFVDGVPWAHLDIAGTAWQEKEKDELNRGGVAFGVRSLSYFLLFEAANNN